MHSRQLVSLPTAATSCKASSTATVF
ncbi:hypothetical protein PMIN01_12597 [Paraphaeosphaeria minitans]|uniref:Uncharacterized protein n=1 Tax=Paraphaeosphaeria minitans TaxID=565426 RepID=A0A9P6G738_9PLEO|nr:hypothetical protein PMIN01_12597 [Paraphaeosphaeria minitans]